LKKLYFHNWVGLVWIGVLLLFAFSCASKAEYAGLYKAQEGDSKKYAETYIELNENGKGTWRVADDEDEFSWEIKKGNELRLNTKSGGVIVGQIQDDTIVIVLAERKKIVFKKSNE